MRDLEDRGVNREGFRGGFRGGDFGGRGRGVFRGKRAHLGRGAVDFRDEESDEKEDEVELIGNGPNFWELVVHTLKVVMMTMV